MWGSGGMSLRLRVPALLNEWQGYPFYVLKLSNIGAFIITYTISGAPYYNYSIMGPKTLF